MFLLIMANKKKKGFFAEFKEFIAQGNVLDMAIGVVIGAAFKAIVTSLVDNIINPLIGLAINTSSLADAKWIIKEGKLAEDGITYAVPEVAVQYGLFLKSIIDFIIVAFCLFCALKVVMGIKSKAEEARKKQEKEETGETGEAVAVASAQPSPEETSAAALQEILAILKEDKNNKN